MRARFKHVLILSALVLSSTAAYFSVVGMASLFSGAYWQVVVMVSGLELAKLVTASYLYRYWSQTFKLLKVYLAIGVVAIMLITSAGVYGFLSSAYSVVASKQGVITNQASLLAKKRELMQRAIQRVDNDAIKVSNRIETLSAQRQAQEARIDTLYKRGMYGAVKRVEQSIKAADSEISKLSQDRDGFESKTQALSDSLAKIAECETALSNTSVNSELGPLVYISKLTGKTVDVVVNFFIFLLVFVFDPLAVCLVIATNKVMEEEKQQPKPMKVAKQGEQLQKIDHILNAYLTVCKQAAAKDDDTVFNTFKSHPDYQAVLEHLSKGIGENHLRLIERNNRWMLHDVNVWDNDKYGLPKKDIYDIEGGKQLTCSPTTLQYISVASNLKDLFGDMKGWIVCEIGGGYGGQCKIIQDLNDITQYDIIDLEEAGDLQRKYLSKLNCYDKVCIMNDQDYISAVEAEYNLVISNYAITELLETEQLQYIERICLNSKHGYLTCNNPLHGVELLREKFKSTFKVSPDIEGERSTNYLITW